MSVDLSNPEVQRLQHAVLEKADPTTWFLLQYDPSNASSLIPLASGPDAPLPQIKENLGACGEDLVYGYADVQGKGLVVVYMVESIGGVRRARAVVHSRALASLFPDYSALITINQASDLTDELVAEKLGLDAAHISSGTPSSNGPTQPIPTVIDPALGGTESYQTAPASIADDNSRSLSPSVLVTDRSQDSSPSKYPTTQDPTHQPSLSSDRVLPSGTPLGLQPRSSSSSRPLQSPPVPAASLSSDQVQNSTPGPAAIPSHPPEPRSPGEESRILTPSSAPAVDSHSPPPTILGPPVDLVSSSDRVSGEAARSQLSASPPPPPVTSGEQDAALSTVPAPSGADGQPSEPSQALQRDLDLASGNADAQDPTTPNAPQGRSETKDLPTVTPSGQPAPLPLADRMNIQTISPLSDRLPSPTQPTTVIQPDKPLDPKGIASADFFPEQRNRKTSLTTRLGSLGHAFGRGGSPRSSSGSAPQEQGISSGPGGQSPSSTATPSQKGPGSPTMSRFINSNLLKNFGRRKSGTGIPSPPVSPRDASRQDAANTPPPLPPKDNPSPLQSIGPSPARIPQPSALSSNFMGNQSISTGGRPDSAGQGSGRGGGISPSPSAKLALATASQKSVRSEMEIQERFRRDLELKAQEREKERLAEENGASNLADGGEEEGLPYDRPDPDDPEELVDGPVAKEVTPHQGLTSSELKGADGVQEKLAAADLAETGAAGAGAGILAQSMAAPATEGRARAEGVPEDVSPATSPEDTHPTISSGTTALPTGQPVEEPGRGTEEAEQREAQETEQREAQEVEQRRKEEAAQQAQEEDRRVKAEQAEADRRRAQEDRLKREEEERLQREEAEKLRFAEEKKVQAEREAEEQRVKAEKEEQRLKVEREAEEQRIRAEKEAQELQRKAEIRAEMMSGKREGRVMLNGWITVQTTKSLTWRRRHFTLFAHEMQLFKSEGDPKPIQTVHLGDSAKVSHTYEESQVQGSFKITASDGEDYFLYTDSAEDRETVLEGLAVVLGQ